jgi:hypothetical protein
MSDTRAPERHQEHHQQDCPLTPQELRDLTLKADNVAISAEIMRMAHVTSGVYRRDVSTVKTLQQDQLPPQAPLVVEEGMPSSSSARKSASPTSPPEATASAPITTTWDSQDITYLLESDQVLMKMLHNTSGVYPEDFLLSTLTAPSQQLDRIAPSQPPHERTNGCVLL